MAMSKFLTVRCSPLAIPVIGVDRVASEVQSPSFTVGPLGRVAATRGSTVNPACRVSPPGAGVGGNLGGKGNGAGSRSPQAAGFGGGVPPVGGLSPRVSSDDLPAPLPVGEVRSSKKVTFSDSGSAEALKAVDLLGSVLVGFGVDLEALPSTQLSDVAPTRRLLAQEYNKQTEKMDQLQKNFRLGGVGFLELLKSWNLHSVLWRLWKRKRKPLRIRLKICVGALLRRGWDVWEKGRRGF